MVGSVEGATELSGNDSVKKVPVPSSGYFELILSSNTTGNNSFSPVEIVSATELAGVFDTFNLDALGAAGLVEAK